jgi:hypothetical protein
MSREGQAMYFAGANSILLVINCLQILDVEDDDENVELL